MIDLFIFLVMIVVAYFTGSIAERKHFKSIRRREAALINQPYIVDQWKDQDFSSTKKVELVHGGCVIAADKFKMIFGGLLSIFGGRISAFESLTDRARREAILRMREKARYADMVICTRIQHSKINASQVEVIAYGTAIYMNGPKSVTKAIKPDEEIHSYAF